MADYGHGRSRLRGISGETQRRGRFGRMFELPPLGRPGDKEFARLLALLSASMFDTGVDVPATSTKDIEPASNLAAQPAGYSFLGQFVDHDLTFDPSSKLQKENDVDVLVDYRTPAFDLDSVYGGGPDDAPYLYESRNYGRFLIDRSGAVPDLPRNSEGIALLGDARNDDNRILSQIHLLFLHFHNRVYDSLVEFRADPVRRFALSSRMVRFHYQWIVLTDLLPRVVRRDVLERAMPPRLLERGARNATQWSPVLRFFWRWSEFPYLPVEFGAAAFRYGHSTLRNAYALNSTSGAVPLFSADSLDLRGRRPLTAGAAVDWAYFFPLPDRAEVVQSMRAIDTLIAGSLARLPSEMVQGPPSLPLRTLLRGVALGLPSGQAVARTTGLSEHEIISSSHRFYIGPRGYRARSPAGGLMADPSVPVVSESLAAELSAAFADETPLWYYILKEAEVFEGGQRLGWVGSTVVTEVFLGLLAADPASFQNESPQWRPMRNQFGCKTSGVYTFADLIGYASAPG